MTVTARPSLDAAPACASRAALFQHPLLEEPRSAVTQEQRRQQAALSARAAAVCQGCPLLVRCLHDAVVRHDVAGFVAGTTAAQRQQLRVALGVRVAAEDLDVLAGAPTGHRSVDHSEVLRMRLANPHESLETIAHRLGCSLSTVKRHLRRARAEREQQPAPRLSSVAPTREQVVQAWRELTGRPPGRRRAA